MAYYSHLSRLSAATLQAAFASATVGLLALFAINSVGCSNDEDQASGDPQEQTESGDDPLSELDPLFEGAPSNDKLPEEGKADAVYPKKFTDLISFQSPVKSQGGRGVCSIFATTALMEHLYIKEGQIKNPDFSEQYLQWSAKFEVGAFKDTEGSSNDRNLEAINRFGIVTESDWPFESSRWSTAQDPGCTGEEKKQPTVCFTNGSPPEKATSAKKFKLPAGRWINSSPTSIKAHMNTKKQAAAVGLKFFYQAWNHRAGPLPVNNDYYQNGYVTYPNDKDKTESEKKPAGHAVLLVGWDDELVVQKRDGDGKLLTNADGSPQTEKGFFLFKNSWGTGSFGVKNPNGAGYGWVSYEYVKQYGTVYVSDIPQVQLPEVCNDGIDNDGDKKIDCQDSDCSKDPACAGATTTFQNDTAVDIPDNDKNGIKSEIVVADGGSITALAVTVDITHPYRGDLTVKLVKDGTEVVLHEKQGGGEDNLQKTFAVTNFNGKDAAGTWTLVVTDTAKSDKGKLNKWSLDISLASSGGSTPVTSFDENTEDKSIPDNNSTGVFTNISVDEPGAIKSMKVFVDITHPYKGDLAIKLQKVGLPNEVVLMTADGSDGPFAAKTFTVADFAGQDAKGTWRLTVSDAAAQDAGTLNGWSLELSR